MESNLKTQTQLFTFTLLNLMKVIDTQKEELNPIILSKLQESCKYLSLSLETYLSATSSLQPVETLVESNAQECEPLKEITKRGRHRQMVDYFSHHTQIKHSLEGDEWIGEYNAYKDVIVFREKEFSTLYGFVKEHYFYCQRPYIQVNAWKVCKYKKNGVWVNTSNL